MPAAADPTDAKLPLPGGKPDATVKVTPLLCGTGTWSDAYRHRREGRLAALRATGIWGGGETTVFPIIAFLVEHPSAGPILIDAGLHPSVAVDKKQNVGRLLAATGARGWRMEPEQAIPDQLRKRGIEPADIGLIVMTHLHFDHASGMVQFPGATFTFSKQEWEVANTLGWRHGYVESHFDHAFDYRLLDFDDPSVGSFAGFGRSFDLLGDGSIRVAFTPGHTMGHMSVILRGPEREVLVVGDAAYTRHALETGHKPFLLQDSHLFSRSLREIQRYVEQTPSAIVIPGHEMEPFEEARAALGAK
jgi:glyoxylase-like metal-dependent hydrolase (beta-lactamase superfamily II)